MILLQGCDPVKLTVKNIAGPDWMVACMIPKGNMMVSMLKKVEDKFTLVQFNCSKKETKDNKELEAELKSFLEKGISNITKNGRKVKCILYMYPSNGKWEKKQSSINQERL